MSIPSCNICIPTATLYFTTRSVIILNDFSSFLENWGVFYTALSGATAVFTGLIFLAVSLKVELFTRSGLHEPREVAWQTFLNFFWVFVISIFFLMPNNSATIFGVILSFLNVAGIFSVIRRWLKSYRNLTFLRNIIAFMPLLLCYLILFAIGIWSTFNYNALTAVAPILIILLGIAIYNAWELLFAYKS